MEQIKRQRSCSWKDEDDEFKRQKQVETVETKCSTRVTCLEDLSNELIYEVFDFFHFHRVYEAFYALNTRFDNLIIDSSLPIKLNLSSISKSTFERFHQDIIVSNKHRITSLHLSNICLYEHISSPLRMVSEFLRLNTLCVCNIESTYLDNLVHELSSLPFLSSLTISSISIREGKMSIYCQLFRLPALKYCNCLLDRWFDIHSLPSATDKFSPIEHLIIKIPENFNEIQALLSYVPHLRRLSLHFSYNSSVIHVNTPSSSRVLNHLADVHLTLYSMRFDQLEELVPEFFPLTIQSIRISITDDRWHEYLNAHRWEQLIISYMPGLRIFDIRLDFMASADSTQLPHEAQVGQFTSPFWLKRQWFFESYYYQSGYGNRVMLHSINPYRRKDYMIYKQTKEKACSCPDETHMRSVQHVRIQSEQEMRICQRIFSNATKLTFGDGFSSTRHTITPILNRLMPLQQLTELAIECHHFSLTKLVELLRFTPHMQTLLFQSLPIYTAAPGSMQENETFRLISSTNTITKVTFKDRCTLDRLRLLVALCPRLHHLSIKIHTNDIASIIRYVLDKTNQNTKHFSSLCLSEADSNWPAHLRALIESEALLNDYILKMIHWNLYLWW